MQLSQGGSMQFPFYFSNMGYDVKQIVQAGSTWTAPELFFLDSITDDTDLEITVRITLPDNTSYSINRNVNVLSFNCWIPKGTKITNTFRYENMINGWYARWYDV